MTNDIAIQSDPAVAVRLLDAVDVITGVSGGSFIALAYGLYGDKLFTASPIRPLTVHGPPPIDVYRTLLSGLHDVTRRAAAG